MPITARKSELAPALARLREKQAALLYDLANEIAPAELSGAELSDAALRRRFLALTAPVLPDDVAEVNRARVTADIASLALSDRLTLCRILAERAGLAGYGEDELLSVLLPQEPQEEMSENRVVYLRSSYSDEAFLRFSRVIPELRADYASSFSAVCESVYDGRARLCILPLENDTDGSLSGFRALIARYGLKILHSCDVRTAEGQSTRFALLRRSLSTLPTLPSAHPIGRFFRFSLRPCEQASLADLLTAAERCSLPLYKIDAIPISYTEGDFTFDVTLCAGGDLPTFLVYLLLHLPDFEPFGLYAHHAER